MKYSVIAAAYLASSAYAVAADPPSRVHARDLATVTGVIGQAGTDIDSLQTAVDGFSGDVGPVTSASSKLISDLKAGQAKVSGSSQLSLNDALGLQQPVKDLQSKGEKLESSLSSKKSTIEGAGLCDVTRIQVTQINTNTQALIKAVVAKVPEEAQSIAQSLAQGLIDTLNKAQSDFSEQNCVNKKGSGGGSSSSAGPTSSAAGSSSASAPDTSTAETSPATSTATSSAAGGYANPTGINPSYQPTGTGGGSYPTGSSSPPTVTAGAALVAPAGALAVALAAALL